MEKENIEKLSKEIASELSDLDIRLKDFQGFFETGISAFSEETYTKEGALSFVKDCLDTVARLENLQVNLSVELGLTTWSKLVQAHNETVKFMDYLQSNERLKKFIKE